jgi:predicted GIY-YIG superfamily endonuclease
MIGGSVYKITDNNNIIVYIGSTTRNINKRFREHKYKSLNSLKPLYIYIRSIGINNFKFEVLHTSQFNDIVELRQKEKTFIINHNPMFNKNMPSRTKCEYRREMRTKIRRQADERIECIYCNKIYPRNHKSHHRKTIMCLEKKNQLSLELNSA